MNKLFSVLVVFLSISTIYCDFVPTKPCCTACQAPTVQYWSLDTVANHCGYSCIRPSAYKIYKIFEKNLERVEKPNPCEKLGYTEFFEHARHGVWPLLADVDIYS